MAPAPRTAATTRTRPAPGRTRTSPARTRTGPSGADSAVRRPRPGRPHPTGGAPARSRTARLSTGGEAVVLTSVIGAGRRQRVRLLAHPAVTVVAADCVGARGRCAGHPAPSAPVRAASMHPLPVGVGRTAGGPLSGRSERGSPGTDHVLTRGRLAYGRGSGPGPGPALDPVPRGPAAAGRVVPPRRAAELVVADDLHRRSPLRRALLTSSATRSVAPGALTDGDRSGERRTDRPVTAAASRPRRTTRARGGRDA